MATADPGQPRRAIHTGSACSRGGAAEGSSRRAERAPRRAAHPAQLAHAAQQRLRAQVARAGRPGLSLHFLRGLVHAARGRPPCQPRRPPRRACLLLPGTPTVPRRSCAGRTVHPLLTDSWGTPAAQGMGPLGIRAGSKQAAPLGEAHAPSCAAPPHQPPAEVPQRARAEQASQRGGCSLTDGCSPGPAAHLST